MEDKTVFELELPIKETYKEFYRKYKTLNINSAIYKITFESKKFYIGRTDNFVHRMYKHFTLGDAFGCDRLSNKQKEVITAITFGYAIKIEILKKDSSSGEREFIKPARKSIFCLNMTDGNIH